MSDDDLMSQLGEVMAEQDTVDPRLEAYASGSLSPDERAALEREAEDDPVLAETLALYRPLSPLVHKRIAKEVAPVRRRWVGALAGLAAAAAIAFVFFRPAPLPNYRVSVDAADTEWRGAQPVRASTMLTLIARPDVAVDGSVEARLFRQIGAGPATVVDAPVNVSPDGAARWIGRADRLAGVATGTVTFVAIVGRSGALPDEPTAPPSASWTAARAEIVLHKK